MVVQGRNKEDALTEIVNHCSINGPDGPVLWPDYLQ